MTMRSLTAAVVCLAVSALWTLCPASADEPQQKKVEQVIVVAEHDETDGDAHQHTVEADIIAQIHKTLMAHLDQLPEEARKQVEAELKKLHAHSDEVKKQIQVRVKSDDIKKEVEHRLAEHHAVIGEIKQKVQATAKEHRAAAEEIQQRVRLKLDEAGVNAEDIKKRIQVKLKEAGINADDLHKEIELRLEKAGVNAEEIKQKIQVKLDEAGIDGGLQKRIELKFDGTDLNTDELKKRISEKLKEHGHGDHIEAVLEQLDNLPQGVRKAVRIEASPSDKAAPAQRKTRTYRLRLNSAGNAEKNGARAVRVNVNKADKTEDHKVEVRVRKKDDDVSKADAKVEVHAIVVGEDGKPQSVKWVGNNLTASGSVGVIKPLRAAVLGSSDKPHVVFLRKADDKDAPHAHDHDNDVHTHDAHTHDAHTHDAHTHDHDAHQHAHEAHEHADQTSAGNKTQRRAILVGKDGKVQEHPLNDFTFDFHVDGDDAKAGRRILMVGPGGKHDVQLSGSPRVRVARSGDDKNPRHVEVEWKADGKATPKGRMIINVDGKVHEIELDGYALQADDARRIVRRRVESRNTDKSKNEAADVLLQRLKANPKAAASGTDARLDRLENEMKEIRKLLEQIKNK